MTISKIFPLRHAGVPEALAGWRLRPLLGVLRDLMVRMARARTRADALAEAVHAAARTACYRGWAGLDPGLVDAPCAAHHIAPAEHESAALEAFAGNLARAAIRLGRRRLRSRRATRRVQG
jgi:hypothetical protein